MAIISRTEKRRDHSISILVRYAVGYIVIILLCLTFMNTYPVVNMRTMLCESKRSAMQNQSAIIASSLSSLTVLNPDEVEKVIRLLGDLDMTRLIVTDQAAAIVYDSSDNEGNRGRYALFSEVTSALEGNFVFYYNFGDAGTRSRAAVPVMYRGKVIGAVYLYEYSTEHAQLVSALRTNLRSISLAAFAASLLLAVLLAYLLNHRMRRMVRGIKSIADGHYETRIPVEGRDELDELARELNVLALRLQQTEELRHRFVSDASHELKTPLAGIRLLSDSIVQNEDMPPELLREFATDIGQEAERLSRTTEKLLQLTRLDVTGKDKLGPVEVDQVIRSAMKMLSVLATERKVTLEQKLGEGCVIYANADDIHQVVFNLVENAIKYNVEGGRVTVLLYARDGDVCLLIDDTGIGIPEEDIPHIFDRFYRVDKARNSARGGSGLGLAIVKDTVEKHGGRVTVSRRENGGTRFSVRFPLWHEKEGEA